MAHKVFLVELNTAIRIRDWVAETSSNGTWSRTLDADMHALTALEQNGTLLTETTSTAGLATAGTWYFNPNGRKLWARTNDASNPSTCTNTMITTILEPMMHGGGGGGLIKTRGTADLFWDNRVIGLPSVNLRITPEELGAGSIATFGELIVNNADARFDRLVGERIFAGQTATILIGRPDDAHTAYTTWLKAVMEAPSVGVDVMRVPMVSIGRRLDRPIITSVYSTADFADLDQNIIGFNRPKMWGAVIGAEAFRVATCTWEIANHAITCMTLATAKTALGDAVCTSCQDLANGRFTAATSYADTEDRLYINARGYAKATPGELIVDILKDAGYSTSLDVDGSALATLDTTRGVSIGFQVRGGTISEALDIVARSAFIDWFVTRTNTVSGRVRARDAGNLIANAGFETDTAGWSAQFGATIARTTAIKFRGVASLNITKACESANSNAEALVTNLDLTAGKSYTMTLLAALSCAGASTQFAIGLTDGGGSCGGSTRYISDPVTLSTGEWTRVTHSLKGFLRDALYWSSTSILMSNQSITFGGQGGEVIVRPQDGGVDSLRVAIDDVEVVETLVLDDTNARYSESATQSPIIYRVRAGYAFDGRLQTRRFSQKSDVLTQRLFPTAESREVAGHLVCTTDGETVAQAILDYFSALRVRTVSELLSPEDERALNIGNVIDQQTGRRPSLPGAGRLFRVTAFSEGYDADAVPRSRIEAEAQTDPIFAIEALSIT